MRPSHAPHVRKPLRLLAFGGAALVDASGAVVAEQRRRLALLCLVAAGRGQGVSRDKLVAYLSPESPSESARHALQQLVYYVRQQAGDDLFIGTDPLRLNPAVITSDVVEFEEAVRRGAPAEAAALYRGPYLDGFHLADSVEFDEWASGERVRLAGLYAEALLSLATAAERDADPIAASHWWRQLGTEDPGNGIAALGLTRALQSAGDRPEAPRDVRAAEARVIPATGAEHVPAPPPQTSRWRRLAVAGALSAVCTLAAATAFSARSVPPSTPAPTGGVAVMPFVTPADPSLGWLQEGLVELLAIRLAGADGSGVVDARRSIAAWAGVGGTAGREPPAAAVLRAARGLGAAQAVTGSVVGTGTGVVIVADLVDLASGRSTARVEVRGRIESLLQLVDTLAVRLVSIEGGEDMLRAGVLGASSVPAVRAYLAGGAALRRGQWSAAVAEFDRALGIDSTFASAAIGLRRASAHLDGNRVTFADSVAWRHQTRLGSRERAIFLARMGPGYPAWYPIADRLAAWRAMTSRDHANGEAWQELGLVYYHHGARLGAPDPMGEARIALERAMELLPSVGIGTPARMQLIAIAAVTGDTALLTRALRGVPAAGPDTMPADWRRWLRHFTSRDAAALARTRPELLRMRNEDLTSLWSVSQRAGYALDEAVRAESIVIARSRTAGEKAAAAAMRYALALNRGRPREAQDVAASLVPEWRPLSRRALQVLSALYGDGDTTAGVAAAATLAPEVTRPLATEPSERRSQMIHVCISAQWALAHGDTDAAHAALGKLRTPEPGAEAAMSTVYETCAAGIEAWRAVAGRRRDARRRVERFDSLLTTGVPWHWALPDHRIAARLWDALGEPDRALAAVRRRRLDIVTHLAADLAVEGRLALRARDTAGAIAAWTHYLALRGEPEPERRPEADRVRQELAALGGARR